MNPSVPLSLLVLLLTAPMGLDADGGESNGTDGRSGDSRRGLVSPRIAAAIRSSLPDYEPPPSHSEDDMTDIVVLDLLTVIEKRPPSATEWDFLTEGGRAAYLKQHYKGAAVPGDPLSDMVHNYGMLMHREEVRLQRLQELDDNMQTLRTAGYTGGLKELKQEILKARMRPNDWKAESMDKSYNNNRR